MDSSRTSSASIHIAYQRIYRRGQQLGRRLGRQLGRQLGTPLVVAFLLTCSLLCPTPAYAESLSAPADDGASFSSSQLHPDAADPCMIKVGSTYYLFVTTEDWGIPYYSSTDLKNWTLAGNALASSAFAGTGLSRGDVWAPEVRERTVAGRTTYVLTYTAADYWDREYRICVAEAERIEPGAFGSPTVIDTGSVRNAIDSDLFFEGGDTWLYFKNEDEYHSICVERLGANWQRISEPQTVLRQDQTWETWTIEGPWMLKWGSTYYLMYSSGGYTTGNYCIGYATSSSPEGPFVKQTTTAPLVRSQSNVIGPGHNCTLMVGDNELYLVYHSLYQTGEPDRRLMMDRMGIDADGRMFVNFAGFGQQPLPSGVQGYYQLPSSDYRVSAHGVQSVVLSDVVSGQSDDVSVGTVDASSLMVDVADGYYVADLWLFGTGTGLTGTAELVINGTQTVGGYTLSGSSCKLTLPNLRQYVRSVELRLSSTQSLSELLLVSRGKRWGVPAYRLYNPNSGEHFFTMGVGERDYLASIGWHDEGEGWTAPEESASPVFRLYNPNGGEHHYTTSAQERDWLASLGWNDEGLAWYSADSSTLPVYRVYNPNAFANNHHFTTSATERDWLVSLGWRDEGIAWYAAA